MTKASETSLPANQSASSHSSKRKLKKNKKYTYKGHEVMSGRMKKKAGNNSGFVVNLTHGRRQDASKYVTTKAQATFRWN